MKKITLSSILALSLFSYSQAEDLVLKKGWNNVGFSSSYNVANTFKNIDNINFIWYFNPSDKNWQIYSSKDDIKALIDKTNYQTASDLPVFSGVWIDATDDTSISEFNVSPAISSEFVPSKTLKYENRYFGYGYIDGKIKFATSMDNINWDVVYSVESNSGYSYQNSSYNRMFVWDDNKATFIASSYIYFSYDDENNIYIPSQQKVVAVNYNDGVITEQILSDTSSYIYHRNIFLNKDNNPVVFIEDYVNRSYKTYQSDGSSWTNIKNFNEILDINYKYNYDINNSKEEVMDDYKKIDTITVYEDGNTNFYNNNFEKQFSLVDGKYYDYTLRNYSDIYIDYVYSTNVYNPNITYYNIDSDEYQIYFKGNYNHISPDNEIAVVKNKTSVNYTKFNSTVREIGIIDSKLYAFTHNDIGEKLTILSSSNNGISWNIISEIYNFNYQISRIENIYESNGEIYCKLRVNNDFYIESTGLKTWTKVTSLSKILNKPIKNNIKREGEYIEIQNGDGTYSLVKNKR